MIEDGSPITPPADTHNVPCCIVALLASAGGLAPIQQILRDIPVDSGAAFFVFQHLSPDNENKLPELLQKHCDMDVHSAQHQQAVEANQVYVSPPGYNVTLSKGLLHLQSQQGLDIRNQSFNTFLESLAIDQQDKAIAVVLSGASDDGRIGAIVVRQAGGLVIVQDPDTAEFRSMPDRIIEMSGADITLAPDKIAPMLSTLIRDHKNGLSLDANSEGYRRIMARLKDLSEVDFSRYKMSTVKRRISRRMLLNKLEHKVDAYLELIEQSNQEVELLSRDLLIGVSSFFRDKDAFDALKASILPRLCMNAKGRELRIWVAGCATGEEAYSFAILCLDFFASQGITKEIKVLASDINPESIRKANEGLYTAKQVADLSKQHLSQYFQETDGAYRVCDGLKKKVIFFKHDLTKDIPFSNIDLVSCRNVFIYLKPEIQQHIVRCFAFSLNKGGALMLSPSESLASHAHFDMIDERWRIYELTKKPRFFGSSLPGWRMAMDQSYIGAPKKNSNNRTIADDIVKERLLQFLAGRYIPLVLLMTAQGEIIYVLGDSTGILHFPSGEPLNDLSRFADPNLRLTISMGLKTLETNNESLFFSSIPVQQGQTPNLIDLRMHKLYGTPKQSDLIVVLFERISPTDKPLIYTDEQVNLDKMTQQRIQDLEEELYFTKQNLRTAVEELEATNEELQSANEEMQSGNEELQSTNEELQSTNEELIALNYEFQQKAAEFSALNDDIHNLMVSSELITLFVDAHKKIRQLSPKARQVFNLSPQDISRPLEEIIEGLFDADIISLVENTLERGKMFEIEDTHGSDSTYLIRINPFITSSGAISGATINFLDITSIRHIEAEKDHLAAVVTQSHDPIIIYNLDGNIISWNKGAQVLFGYTEEQALRLSVDNLVPDKHRAMMRSFLNATLKGQNLGIVESKRITQSGTELTVSLTLTLLLDNYGKPFAIATTEHDISQQHYLAEEARLAAVAFETMDSIMITDADGWIMRVNASFTDITGFNNEEAIGQKPSILHSGRHQSDFYQAMWSTLLKQGSWEGDIWNKKKNGVIFPARLSITGVKNRAGTITHYIGVFRDITEVKEQEANIHRLAYFDSLTELPNRRMYSEKISKSIALCHRLRVYGALMFIDLDRFKIINDSLGHSIGDELLIAVSKRLKSVLREEDFVARLGGDEFVIITTELGYKLSNAASNAEKLAQKILALFSTPFSIKGYELNSSPSIGVALFPNKDDNAEDLLRQADNAMYLSKKMGRNTVRFFDPSLQAEADAWLTMEKDLRQALKNNEFKLHYQPQFNDKGVSTSVEALIRWDSPEKGRIQPNKFLPICEDTGLILNLGRWILNEACQQMAQWAQEQQAISIMAINISATQFMCQQFETEVLEAINNAGIRPESIELEVTENLLLENIDEVSAKMARLKKIGLRFSIDDFGTGYSSLAYIKKLPIDQIKIDQTFIRDILTDKDDASIVESTIAMATRLGLDIIAEGVETKEQLQYLASCGCPNFQGYLFSPAIPADELFQVIEKQSNSSFF